MAHAASNKWAAPHDQFDAGGCFNQSARRARTACSPPRTGCSRRHRSPPSTRTRRWATGTAPRPSRAHPRAAPGTPCRQTRNRRGSLHWASSHFYQARIEACIQQVNLNSMLMPREPPGGSANSPCTFMSTTKAYTASSIGIKCKPMSLVLSQLTGAGL